MLGLKYNGRGGLPIQEIVLDPLCITPFAKILMGVSDFIALSQIVSYRGIIKLHKLLFGQVGERSSIVFLLEVIRILKCVGEFSRGIYRVLAVLPRKLRLVSILSFWIVATARVY